MIRKHSTLWLPFFCTLLFQSTAQAQTCPVPSSVAVPNLYQIGWIPWIGDLKSWRNYDPKDIPGVGRLIPSPDGRMAGEPLSGPLTCNILQPGEYTYVMKWQDNEVNHDYIENTDIVYLNQPIVLGPDYIRHSQIAAGFPVFCAGTFKIKNRWWPIQDELSEVNEVVEITNFSGHYKPLCKCLGVLEKKLEALKVDTGNAQYYFLGSVKDCK
jgi:hypothetical protein